MSTIYFGFALSSNMFSGNVTIQRQVIPVQQVVALANAGKLTSCLNASHVPTVQAMQSRFGINVPIPKIPPIVQIQPGQSIIVMAVQGLPRLTTSHQYTQAQIAAATFNFVQYTVL